MFKECSLKQGEPIHCDIPKHSCCSRTHHKMLQLWFVNMLLWNIGFCVTSGLHQNAVLPQMLMLLLFAPAGYTFYSNQWIIEWPYRTNNNLGGHTLLLFFFLLLLAVPGRSADDRGSPAGSMWQAAADSSLSRFFFFFFFFVFLCASVPMGKASASASRAASPPAGSEV